MDRAPPNNMVTTAVRLFLFAGFCLGFSQGTKSLCPQEFNHRCTCGATWFNERADVYVTNCSNANFDRIRVMEELPVDTEILIVTGNDFPRLAKNLFGTLPDYVSLREIDLSNNKIRTIDEGTFTRHERKVEKLTLNDNKWIPSDGIDIFSNFDRLRELHLSNAFTGHNRLNLISRLITSSEKSLVAIQSLDISDNGITDIDNDDFLCFLQFLRILNLSKNKLTQINLTPRCLPSLMSLDLSHNQIITLDLQSMSLIDKLIDTRFDLSGNPIQCDCGAIDMINWWQNTTAELLISVKCSGPKPWTGQFIDTIDAERIENDCEDHGPSVGTIVLIIVLMILIALIIGLLIVNRTTVRKYFVNTTKPIRDKFEYSAISGRQEMPEVDV